MSSAIGDMLPLAVAVAISPLPLIALMLILFSHHARSNGPAYLLGWLVGLIAAVAILLALVNALNLAPGGGPTTLRSLLQLLVGVLLVYLGIRQWRKVTKPGHQSDNPRWMTSIDSFTPVKAFVLAVLLSSVGNIALIVAAALAIYRSQLNIGQEVTVSAIFIVIGSLLVATVVTYHFVARERAAQMLDSWKVWLLANNGTLTAVLLVIVGMLLVGKGIGSLNLFG